MTEVTEVKLPLTFGSISSTKRTKSGTFDNFILTLPYIEGRNLEVSYSVDSKDSTDSKDSVDLNESSNRITFDSGDLVWTSPTEVVQEFNLGTVSLFEQSINFGRDLVPVKYKDYKLGTIFFEENGQTQVFESEGPIECLHGQWSEWSEWSDETIPDKLFYVLPDIPNKDAPIFGCMGNKVVTLLIIKLGDDDQKIEELLLAAPNATSFYTQYTDKKIDFSPLPNLTEVGLRLDDQKETVNDVASILSSVSFPGFDGKVRLFDKSAKYSFVGGLLTMDLTSVSIVDLLCRYEEIISSIKLNEELIDKIIIKYCELYCPDSIEVGCCSCQKCDTNTEPERDQKSLTHYLLTKSELMKFDLELQCQTDYTDKSSPVLTIVSTKMNKAKSARN